MGRTRTPRTHPLLIPVNMHSSASAARPRARKSLPINHPFLWACARRAIIIRMGNVYYLDERREIRSAAAVSSLPADERRREVRALLGHENATSAELWGAMQSVSALPDQPDVGRKRHDPIPEDRVIRLRVADNPKRAGSPSHRRFALYRDGMTVGEFLKAGGQRSDIAWDVDKGWISVEAPPPIPGRSQDDG